MSPSPDAYAVPLDVDETIGTAPTSPEKTPSTDVHHPTLPDEGEYVLDSIVSNVKVNGVRRYQVRWYAYSATGDTMEPTENIPHNFIARYRAKRQRSSRSAPKRRTRKRSGRSAPN